MDKLTYEMANDVEGSPNIFLKKDWLNILDTQNGNYASNQSVIETSQLANSNKWLSYREAYLQVPLVLTLQDATAVPVTTFKPATTTPADLAIGLKNWYGSMIHSVLLDYNGVTTVQQQNYLNMWNGWKLNTSFSWGDVQTMGPTIGFYPDSYDTWVYAGAVSSGGAGICNNIVGGFSSDLTTPVGKLSNMNVGGANKGLVNRLKWISFDLQASTGIIGGDLPSEVVGDGTPYSDLISSTNINALYKSSVFNKVDGVAATSRGCVQTTIMATIYLRHLHSFFNQVPLIKGAYMRLTLVLNNTTVSFTNTATTADATGNLVLGSVNNAVGGINPIMISSRALVPVVSRTKADFTVLEESLYPSAGQCVAAVGSFQANISVGNKCLDVGMSSLSLSGLANSTSSTPNVLMYVPAYTFNPVFEAAYLSSPIKQVNYTDVYQYSVKNVGAGGQINQLITNGIAGIKSILCLPFFTAGTDALAVSPYMSPFDPAGAGMCSPLCFLNNFNVVVSGANQIYNTQRYNFEEWNNQLYGANSVNAGQTDGLTSGLVDYMAWQNGYGGYYLDLSRMLPVEMSVPKSIQLIGTNTSLKSIDLIIFVEYAVSINIDSLTGTRI